MFWVAVVGVILLSILSSQSRSTADNNYKINPKPCLVNGLEGTCMFVWECINSEGHHVGMCVDTFMFGSCCAHNLTSNQLDMLPDPSEPAVLFTQQSPKPKPKPKPRPKPQTPSGSSRPSHGEPLNLTAILSVGSKPGRPNLSNEIGHSAQSDQEPFFLYYERNHSDHIRPHTSAASGDNMIHVNNDINYHNYGIYSSVNNRTMELERPQSSLYSSGGYEILTKPTTYSTSHQSHNQLTSESPLPSPSTFQTSSPFPSTPSSTYVSISSSRPLQSLFNGLSSTLHHGGGTKPHFVTYHFTTSTSTPLSSHKPSWNLTLLESMNEVDNDASKGSTESSWPHRPSWHVTGEPFVTRPRPSSGLRPKPQRPSYQVPPPISTSTPATTTTAISTTSATSTTKGPSVVVFSSLPLVVTTNDKRKPETSSYSSSTPTSMGNSGNPVSAVSHKGTLCGSSPLHPKHQVRIVGGRNAQFGVWPWQVSVRRTSFFGFSSTHRCGGALLNENWIATAGHCVDDLLASQIRIRVGEYDFSSVQEPYPFSERGVAKKVVHPKYNFFTYEYDLAMVRLDNPLEFAPHIIPICLPGSDDLLIGENATVTGWGRLSEGGTLPSVLQEVSVPIVSNDKCKSMFLRAGRHEFIPDIFMCAGFDDGGRDSCQGDSGGPLQVRGKDGKYFLAGIISWGIGCAEANLPGVCTRISKFVPWILETVT